MNRERRRQARKKGKMKMQIGPWALVSGCRLLYGALPAPSYRKEKKRKEEK
jgi:hypothetical protein